MTTVSHDALSPSMGANDPPTWPGAQWIGAIDESAVGDGPESVRLLGADGYASARLLVRTAARPLGFIEVPIAGDLMSRGDLLAGIAGIDEIDPLDRTDAHRAAPAPLENRPRITVTVSTRDRVQHLRRVLPSLLALDYPNYELLVVDNAPSTSATAEFMADITDPRVRVVTEPRPGLSCGRNRAIVESSADIVAFTDDDVVVDPAWLNALVGGFERDPLVGLVTGMVPTGELRTSAQWFFEARTGWQRTCRPDLFSLTTPRPEIATFPLDVGRYGTGANFAVRRQLVIDLGGFNEALGIGSPACGAEDVDMFVRVIFAGRTLAYEPSAIVWHRHREDNDALEGQLRNYAISWTAWLTSLLENPDTRSTALRLGFTHLRRRLARRRSPAAAATPTEAGLAGMRRVEILALTRGPFAYVRSRRHHQTRPLRG